MIRFKLRFIGWFHSKFPAKYCWADCVSWAYSKRWNPFKIDKAKACEIESVTHSCEQCYCGAWNRGKCWDLISEKEREALRQSETELSSPPF